MKKLLLILTLVFIFSVASYSQEISLPRDVVEDALRSLRVEPELNAKIEAQQKVIDELKAAQQTPCSISILTFNNDLVFWHDRLANTNEENRKEVAKTLKLKRKLGEQSVKSQCNIKSNNRLFDVLRIAAPISLMLLLR